MTLEKLRELYEKSSTNASDINRKLIFAGIAIVWIFKVSSEQGDYIPDVLKPVLLLFCISLCLDVMQYLVRGVLWHVYYYFHRDPKANESTTQAEEPEWLNSIPDSLWYAKFIPTILAYLNLANYLKLTSIETSDWLVRLSGWPICYTIGIIFGILTLWYVVTESYQQKKGYNLKSSILCKCIRTFIGIFAIALCTLEICFIIHS